MNDTGSFLLKVILLSALLSVLIKVGGPALPIRAPFTESLNGLVTAIVVLPSVLIGVVMLMGLKRSL
ncbi:MAG: hypothetical protein AAFP03_05320 [Cyanobacteria bacterium J06598_3]